MTADRYERWSRAELNWRYGPTAWDPDPGKMWHSGCDGEVLYIDDGEICTKCGAQGTPDQEESW